MKFVKKIKIRREIVILLWGLFENILKGTILKEGSEEVIEIDSDFSFPIARNKGLIEETHTVIVDTIKGNSKFQKYDTARIELAKKSAVKDTNNKPIMLPNGMGYKIEDWAKFNEEVENLKKSDEHKEAVEKHEEWIKKEVEIETYIMKLSCVPKGFPRAAMEHLYLFIMYDDELEELKNE